MPNPNGTPANLRRLPKGVSGNLGGRPTAVLRPILLAQLEREVQVGKVTMTEAEAVVSNLLAIARSKRPDAVSAAKLILAYADGPPAQDVVVSGEVEHTVTIDAIRRAIGLAT